MEKTTFRARVVHTSHGFLHRHRFWLHLQTDNMEDPNHPAKDYTAFQIAKKDLITNWQTYRDAAKKATKGDE